MKSQYRVLIAHLLGWCLRTCGYWVAEMGHRVDAWAGIGPEKAGGTSSD
jgi:hypothetical protein